jgi:hypothetical protein
VLHISVGGQGVRPLVLGTSKEQLHELVGRFGFQVVWEWAPTVLLRMLVQGTPLISHPYQHIMAMSILGLVAVPLVSLIDSATSAS